MTISSWKNRTVSSSNMVLSLRQVLSRFSRTDVDYPTTLLIGIYELYRSKWGSTHSQQNHVSWNYYSIFIRSSIGKWIHCLDFLLDWHGLFAEFFQEIKCWDVWKMITYLWWNCICIEYNKTIAMITIFLLIIIQTSPVRLRKIG